MSIETSQVSFHEIWLRYLTGALSVLFLNSLLVAQEMPQKTSPGIPYLNQGMAQTGSPTFTPGVQSDQGFSGSGGAGAGFSEIGPNGMNANQIQSCACGKRGGIRKLFRKKCGLHSAVDPSMIYNPYQEIPLGLQLNETMTTQVRNYENSRQIFYRYDFIDGTSQLNQAGRHKLELISKSVFTNFSPVVVENTPREPGLDHARRLQLVNAFTSIGIPLPAERIMVGMPRNPGMTGPEAIILHGNAMNDLSQSGGMGSAASSVGGLTGSGLLPNTQSSGPESGNP